MSKYKSIDFANDNREKFIAMRRDLHQHPEPGWLEYRTAAMAADRLMALGYDLKVGKEVVKADSRMGPLKRELIPNGSKPWVMVLPVWWRLYILTIKALQ